MNKTTITTLLFYLLISFSTYSQIQIKNEADLRAIESDLSASYVLMNDITLDKPWVQIGESAPFTGSLNGNGHVIFNLNIIDETADNAGLFAQTEGATIRNLGIEQSYIKAGSSSTKGTNAGAFVGKATATLIENSYVSDTSIEGRVQAGSFIGQILSSANPSVIKNSYSTAFVSGRYAGGFVGTAENVEIENVYFTGTVNGSIAAGGILGLSKRSENKISYSLVLSPTIEGGNAGRIVGQENAGSATMSNNYASYHTLTGMGAFSDLRQVSDAQSFIRDIQGEMIGFDRNMYSSDFTPYTEEDIWTAYDTFNKYYLRSDKNFYRAHQGQSDVAAIWVQAIYFDMALNAYKKNPTETNKQLIERLYKGCYNQYDHYNWDNGSVWFIYDDIMWWTISAGRAYQVLGDEKYLDMAKTSFQRVWYGSDVVGDNGSYDAVNGGMYWDWDHNNPSGPGRGKMSCINFPTVIGAMTLYTITGEEDYLEKAKEIYTWARQNLMNPQEGRVFDTSSDKNHNWVYNQATAIGAAILMYKETKNDTFLEDAIAIANFVKNQLGNKGTLPFATHIESGIYTAIFAPYIQWLVDECGQFQFLPWLRFNINQGWANRNTRDVTYKDYYHEAPALASIESYDASGIPALMLVIPPVQADDPEFHAKSEAFYTRILKWDMDGVWKIYSDENEKLLPVLAWQKTPIRGHAPIFSGGIDIEKGREVVFKFLGSHGQDLEYRLNDDSLADIERTSNNEIAIYGKKAGVTSLIVSYVGSDNAEAFSEEIIFTVFDATAGSIQIRTIDDLKAISSNLSGSYILMSDLDFAGQSYTPIGTKSKPFTGKFFGNGYVIDNLNINSSGTDLLGLFGYASGARIQDLYLENINIIGKREVGGIMGKGNKSIIERVYVSGYVEGEDHVGAIAGGTDGGDPLSHILNCYADATVKTRASQAGGILGAAQSVLVEKCYFTGKVEAPTTEDRYNVGGIIALNENDFVGLRDVVSLAESVIGGTANPFAARGNNLMELSNCYALSTMKLTGADADNKGLPRATANQKKTLSQLKKQELYESIGWNFNRIWFMSDSFPILRDVKTVTAIQPISLVKDPFTCHSYKGVLQIDAERELHIKLYTLSGVLLNAFTVNGTAQLPVSTGVYILQATDTLGEVFNLKVLVR